MKKVPLFLFFLFVGCSQKTANEIKTEFPCDFVVFFLPTYRAYLPSDYTVKSGKIFGMLCEEGLDTVINFKFPSPEYSNIDTLLSKIDKINETVTADSLSNEIRFGINVEMPDFPLNQFLKLACFFQIQKYKFWTIDLQHYKVSLFVSNKKNPSLSSIICEELDKNLYIERYNKFVEHYKREKLNFVINRLYFRTGNNVRHLLEQADTVINLEWEKPDNLQVALDNLETKISDFKDKFQKPLHKIQVGDTILMICDRQALSIDFPADIHLITILKIIDLAVRHKLKYEVDCTENRLNILTLCYEDESIY
jgi:hypothetical protein